MCVASLWQQGLFGLVHTYENDLFFLNLPWHRFKNIWVHTDPLKMTENAVVHIPAYRWHLKFPKKWRRRDKACTL